MRRDTETHTVSRQRRGEERHHHGDEAREEEEQDAEVQVVHVAHQLHDDLRPLVQVLWGVERVWLLHPDAARTAHSTCSDERW